MQFTITSAGGEAVKVEATNWMMAMGKAMAFLEVDPGALGRWIVTPSPSGDVRIEDPTTGHDWTVSPVPDTVKVVAVGPEQVDYESVHPEERTPAGPPPRLQMPATPSFAPPREPLFSKDELAEQLFDLSEQLVGELPKEACRRALKLVLDFVPAEAASILKGGINDLELTFVAVEGPVADALIGQKVPFGQGLVGLCFDTRVPIQLTDAADDQHHLARFDEATGFTTRSMLCVPIANADGIFGVIQILNPVSPLDESDVETVRTIGATLASALSPLTTMQ